ncbi:MAG: molecular chaperone HtpG [Bacteroidales bacterium]|nr:molecular chaperone HtpG [Bacteroidales bacterium]
MQQGKIGVTTENIFPIIKKFLYSDHEIFLRELISNAVDATQKLKTLNATGEHSGELGDLTIRVELDEKKKTLTITDRGIGMTAEEVEKYINQIAFSSAEEFLDKYKDKANAIIGHFGLGFYSSFMVSEKVEVQTKSYRENGQAVKWICDGSPEYTLEEIDKQDRGTSIVLHIDKDSEEFLQEHKINELLNKYCKFLPVEIAFGFEKDWKDGKEIESDKLRIINETKPAWTKKPSELKPEDYKKFYKNLFPLIFDEPLFWIHLNVDYPFNLTGILYFPKIKNNLDIQRNKIQLYSNQVFVTDSVEGIVPEFLTLLHGVIDSPDIPLNVSRSYLQSDSNVKKISNHITKKVSDRLTEIFKADRKEFEEKWDDLKVFIQYGMLTEEKFHESAMKFVLLKNSDNKYFTWEEYLEIIKENQTDKHNKKVILYASDKTAQYSYMQAAKEKAYDVLIMDGQLDAHFINHMEQKAENVSFVRVDSNIVEKLIEKDDALATTLPQQEQDELSPLFTANLENDKQNFSVQFEDLSEQDAPMIITQSEWMRRMKDMSAMSGGAYSFYGEMPDSYTLVVNTAHPLIKKLIEEKNTHLAADLSQANDKIHALELEKISLEKLKEGKKEEEIDQLEKDKLQETETKLDTAKDEKTGMLRQFGREHQLTRQLIDLALLSNNMLKGEELNRFLKRSIEMIH